MTTYLLQFDGKSAPTNPGIGTSGSVLFDENGKVLFETGEFLGNGITNNQAEYIGLYNGLKLLKELGIVDKNTNNYLKIQGDSLLVISQVKKVWKIKNEKLKVIYEKCIELLDEFNIKSIDHVYRDKNAHADNITNIVFKNKESFEEIKIDFLETRYNNKYMN